MCKKYLCGILALALSIGMCGCSDSESADNGSAKDQQTQSAAGGTADDASAAEDASSADTPAEEDSPYTLSADFSKGASDKFEISNGWSNGNMFNCTWTDKNCTFEDSVMKLTIDKNYFDEYTAGEYRTKDFYGYGLYEVSMKPISNNGVVSSFFTYTGPSDDNPWDEIDIEFLGKDTTQVQFNYYTNGTGNHEYLYDLGFDASEDFHTYGFKWAEDSITWYVDGKEAYSATENLPVTPSKIMMNAWNGKGVDGWLNAFDDTVPLTAEYQWVRFTAQEDMTQAAE